jgi:insertion element IS1 protein InsB
MRMREACPACGSQQFKKNGHSHNGKQHPQCKACGRQFVLLATQRLLPAADRTLVERWLCERISLHGIGRGVGVSSRWLMDFVSACFTALPAPLYIQPASSPHAVIIQRRDGEADEMCSFVEKKANKQGLWLAMDTPTRQVIALHVGDRSRNSAEPLWANIPAAYREQATCYPDQSNAYTGVMPAAQHQAIPTQARKTNHIERFPNTLRQRVSRLVRAPLAFSKKLENPIGAIRSCICHYNLTRAPALHL